MLPLFDMLANAQNGQAIDAMARQFGLSQDQTRAAMEALLPAFSQGLKQNTADPYGAGAFLSALSTGQHAKYFEDANRAFSPSGIAEGNGILGHLFGSPDLSRTVAEQAAKATGIGQETLKQMLPALASMIMGGLFKQSTGQMKGSGFSAAGNPFGEIIEQMMRQGAGMGGGMAMPHPEAPQPGANQFDNPFGRMLEGMLGGAAQPGAGSTPRPMENPFGRIIEEMMRGAQPGQASAAAPSPTPESQKDSNPGGRSENPYDDLFGKMFETGAKQRDDYQKGMESIFDQFRKGMDR